MKTMILVVGSTGLVGMEVCRLLSKNNHKFRALVRSTSDPGKVAELSDLGAEVCVGDLKQPESLREACSGIKSIISSASSTLSRQEGDSIATVDEIGQLNLIEAAGGAGVEKFVFISFKEAGDTDYPLNQTKRKVERALSDSNMNWTSLQSAYFMEVWLSPALGFDYVNQAARIYGSGENGLSWISYRDVAKFAVEALSNPIADRTILEIGGPEKLSPNEVLKIFERIFGKSFAVERIPIDALKNQKQAASNPLEESFAGLMIQYAKGDEIDMESLLEKVQIDLLSVQDYAQTLAKSAL